MLAPVWGARGDGPWHYTGYLIGFAILYDRDEDGAYESVGHIWTAAAWRRRGISRRLMAEARSRFQFTGIEEPYTKEGAAFMEAIAD
jgi:GNAT superfamily N-acetyltransferase